MVEPRSGKGRFNQAIHELYQSVSEIGANLEYITKEIPALNVSQELRKQVADVCEEFRSCLYDVKKEIRNLEDKLGMHPGEEPFDPNITNPDPKVTIGFIRNWLRRSIDEMHSLITGLENPKEANTTGLYILCAESGANILKAYQQIGEALDSIGRTLDS